MTYSNSLRKDYITNRSLITGVICLFAALALRLAETCPFDRRLIPVLFIASAVYFTFYFFFRRYGENPQPGIAIQSLIGVGVITFLTHFTGGVISPLNCLYFAILASEVACGVTFSLTIYAALASYLGVVLGEAYGLLNVKFELARTIYANPLMFAVLAAPIVCYMGITGYLGRMVLLKIRFEEEEENRNQQAILKRFSELDAYSHIGLLAHRIAHDLRGPLTSISGYIELEQLSPDKDDSERAALADLSETVVNMAKALSDITRFGRAADGKKEEIKMKDFFSSLLSILVFHKDAKNIQFRQNYPDAREISVTAQRQDLQQAYFNILKNAVEAVKDNTGDKIVEISMRQSDGALEVGVTSNGPPVPPEILSQLFHKAVTGKQEGTGVGLMITHDLLMRNDINIEIRNLDGAGVQVRTRIPLKAG